MAIADRILDERLAIVGTTGSGKSYCARGMVERVLDREGGRVGIIDPTGVWHGLRLKADGKTPGYPVVIFGGDRSDVPLTETAGRVIAQAVAGTQQSWIVDTSALGTKAGERRFMLDFLDALFEHNRARIVLVVDEADRFSPQRMSPEVARLHERMEEIVRRGRVRGFYPWLITQRPASLNKDVLSQATALIAMKLTGVHDRDAIAAVIEGQADRAQARHIVNQLPAKGRGQGIVWAPSLGILEPTTFPRIATLDTMTAPDHHGHARADQPLPPIDLGSLRERLASVETEAKANDPAKLKAEVRRLERELEKALAATGPSPEHLQAERQQGHETGRAVGFREGIAHAIRTLQGIDAPRPTAPIAAPVAPVPRPAAAPAGTKGGGAELRILKVLAQRHPARFTRAQWATLSGMSKTSGTFTTYISRLRTASYLDERDGLVAASDVGLAACGTFPPGPQTPSEVIAMWKAALGSGPSRLLDVLLDAYPNHVDRANLADRVNMVATSGTFTTYLSRLRSNGLIDTKGRKLAASPILFADRT